MRQMAVSDHRQQRVRFSDGRLTVGTLLEAGWDGTVDRPASRDRDLSARLGPVRVDLRQALALAGPFLKEPLPPAELTGTLQLQRLEVRLHGSRKGDVALSGLVLDLPRLRLPQTKGGVNIDGMRASVDRAAAPLEAMQPTRADALVAWGVKRCAVAGGQPVVLDGLEGGLQVALTELNLKSRSPRKVAARIDLKQSLDLRRVGLEPGLVVSTLHEQIAARAEAKESGEIEVTLPELRLAIGALQANTAGKKLPPLPLTAVLSASGIRLPAAAGAAAAVERATITVSSGDALQLAATAALAGAPGRVTSDGTVRVDLDRALPLAAPFLPQGAAAGGISTLTWKLAVPLKVKPPGKEKNPLRAARAALALPERGELTATLANRGISWPLAGGTVSLTGLRTPRPIRLVLPGRGGKVTLAGEIAFGGLSGLPGGAAALAPQSGSITLDGEMHDWQSLTLRENLRITPLGLSQRADMAVGRLDGLMEQEKIGVTTLLQRLDATVTAEAAAHFPATLTPVPGGVEIAGNGNAALQLNLAGGKTLRVRATAATRDLGLRLKNGTAVEGMTADVLLDRTYALSTKPETGWSPLSASLVRPLPAQSAGSSAELANRVREDLRGQQRGSRRFTIRKVTVPGDKVPLVLNALEGDLLLTPEETGLSFFQTEMLGGTVRLRGMIDLRPEVPVLSSACSFSNLETDRLLPADVRQKSRTRGAESAVTGEVSLDAPLATGQRELLEGIRMRLNLRRIGRETLERALFSLDPYERNEQVVAQRKLLRNGNLKWLRAGTLDGSFSLEGEVLVKGFNVTLPPVERIRLADLPLQKQMAATLAGVKQLRTLLDLVRADRLTVGPEGKISLMRGGN